MAKNSTTHNLFSIQQRRFNVLRAAVYNSCSTSVTYLKRTSLSDGKHETMKLKGVRGLTSLQQKPLP